MQQVERSSHPVAAGQPPPRYLCVHAAASVLYCQLRRKTRPGRYESPGQHVKELHAVYLHLDEIVKSFNCQKIRSSGLGEYVVVANVSVVVGHAETLVVCATALLQFISQTNYEVFMGMSSGAISTALAGSTMLTHDVYGLPSVVAKTLQLCGVPNSVQISDSTYMLLAEPDDWFVRGYIDMPWGETCAVWILLQDEDSLETMPPLEMSTSADLLVPNSKFWNKNGVPPDYYSCRKLFGHDMRFCSSELESAYLHWKTDKCYKLDAVLCCVCLAVSLISLLNTASHLEPSMMTLLPYVVSLGYSALAAGIAAQAGERYYRYREVMCCVYYACVIGMCCLRPMWFVPFMTVRKVQHYVKFNSVFVGLFCQLRFWVHLRLVLAFQVAACGCYFWQSRMHEVGFTDLLLHLVSTLLLPLGSSYIQDSLARCSFLQKFSKK